MTAALTGPWKDLVERHERLERERHLLEDRMDDALGRPAKLRAEPRKYFGLTLFQWNLLRALVLWSIACGSLGFAIGALT